MFLEILKIVLPFALAVIVHRLTLNYEEKKYERSILQKRVDNAYTPFYNIISFGLFTILYVQKSLMSNREFLKNFSEINKFLTTNIQYFETKSQDMILKFHNAYVIVETAEMNNIDTSKELPQLRIMAEAICNEILVEYRHLCSKLKMPLPSIERI